jgi:hypothetical protein
MTDADFKNIMAQLFTDLQNAPSYNPIVRDNAYDEELSRGAEAFEFFQAASKGRFGIFMSDLAERIETAMTGSPIGRVCAACIELAFEKVDSEIIICTQKGAFGTNAEE